MDVDITEETPSSIFGIYTEDGGGALLREYRTGLEM
jgi:hypothetical protein